MPEDVPPGVAPAVPPAAPLDGLRQLDPRSLRGLAHPLRMRLLAALREHGPATASQLAARLGESSGATSYHLRQLAAHGFIEDDPERGTARERWWKAAHRGNRVDTIEEFLHHPDPAVRGALATVLHEVATQHAEQLGTWLGTFHEWPEAWQRAWSISDFTVRLTPELAEQLGDEVHALIDSYRGRADDVPGTASVRIHYHAFPRTTD